jgi:hypothetical protein
MSIDQASVIPSGLEHGHEQRDMRRHSRIKLFRRLPFSAFHENPFLEGKRVLTGDWRFILQYIPKTCWHSATSGGGFGIRQVEWSFHWRTFYHFFVSLLHAVRVLENIPFSFIFVLSFSTYGI